MAYVSRNYNVNFRIMGDAAMPCFSNSDAICIRHCASLSGIDLESHVREKSREILAMLFFLPPTRIAIEDVVVPPQITPF